MAVPASTFRTSLTPHPHFFLHSPTRPISLTLLKASSDPNPEPEPNSDPPSTSPDDSFDSRLSQVRLRYRSGTGKKAEIRKTKKGKQTTGTGTGTGSGSGSGSGSSMFLPPVALKEPVSGGVKVEFGFSPYSERVNGRLAGIGLVGLIAVELATGMSMIKYHTPAIVFIQVYFMSAVSALYLKFEKEKVSVWPQGDAPPTTTN